MKKNSTLLALGFLALSCRQEDSGKKVANNKDQTVTGRNRDLSVQVLDPPWTDEVKEAYRALYTAPFHQVPLAAQNLAQIGMSAVPAMEHLTGVLTQPIQKRALVSFMLVDRFMFKPKELSRYARNSKPYIQRAALQALYRIGNQELEAVLNEIVASNQKNLTNSKEAAGPPLAEFISFLKKSEKPWNYDEKQLFILDQILQASTMEEFSVAINWVKDTTLEQGLVAIIGSSIVPAEKTLALSRRLVSLSANDTNKLKKYSEVKQPSMLRMSAFQQLVLSKTPANLKYIRKFMLDPEEPLRTAIQELLNVPR